MSLADTADTGVFINEKSGKWNPIKSAPRDGTLIDLWLVVHASPRSFGMGDEYGVPDAWFQDGAARHGSKSPARKFASAMIAKIPEPLSRHIARSFRPSDFCAGAGAGPGGKLSA